MPKKGGIPKSSGNWSTMEKPNVFWISLFFPRKLPYSIANHYSAFMKTGASCRVAQLGEKLKSSAEVFQTASGYALYKHIYIYIFCMHSQIHKFVSIDIEIYIC